MFLNAGNDISYVVEQANKLPVMSSFVFNFKGRQYWMSHETSNWYRIGSSKSQSGIQCNINTQSEITESLIQDALDRIIIQEVHES